MEISGADAAKIGINDGGNIRLSSASGSISLKARVSDALQAGMLFVPSHFREVQVNLLTKDAVGSVAVKVEKG
jgi:predicted molibdopterin-dependent oxidoreductase YjgC